jgi:hypothetical protein
MAYKQKSSDFSKLFAVWTGLEPATPCVTDFYLRFLSMHEST